MAVVTGCFLDTSVLIAGLIEMGPRLPPARAVLAAVAEGELPRPGTAWHCCLEFYAVSTRLPEDLRLSPEDALTLLEENVLNRFEVYELPSKLHKSFLRQAAEDRVAGGRLYDAHIAEIARASGADVVVTDNRRHFTSLLRHGTRVLTAGELLRELAGTRGRGRK